jgi:GNAT superfamily N-acetyltransferase
MKSQHIPMTIDEFHLMPRKLGWKYEYWDGQAHTTPSHSGVVTTSMPVQPRPVQWSCTIRALVEADLAGLYTPYVAAFADSMDYCDWKLADIKLAAEQTLAGYFAGRRGQPLPASQVALDGTAMIGAALIVQKKNGQPFLDLLFVAPQWHRKGVATALVATALNHLAAAGYRTLTSRFVLGNEESRAWHHSFGFVDEPDQFLAGAYYRHAHHELQRRTTLGTLTPAERDALVAEREHWKKEVKRLEALAMEQGLAAMDALLYNEVEDEGHYV